MDDAFRDAPSGQRPDKLLVMDCWLAIDRGQQSHSDTVNRCIEQQCEVPSGDLRLDLDCGPGSFGINQLPNGRFGTLGGVEERMLPQLIRLRRHPMKLEQLLAADENTTADTDAPHLKIAMPLKPLADPYCDIDIATSTPSPIRSTERLVSKN